MNALTHSLPWPLVAHWPLFGPVSLSVRIDALSAIVLLLVSFLLAVVLAYSRRSMAGEPGYRRFIAWMCLTGVSVLVMVASGNLLQCAVAWTATSLCLHRLLVFYPDRRSAQLAARKKFIVSRLGDACLAGALLLAWMDLGTWDYQALFAAARAHAAGQVSPLHLDAMAWLIAAAAILKSAQVPFHSWLPDTMDAPTPVSALMHAGVINAGGFLVMRLAPVVSSSPIAMWGLAIAGALTAVVAALVMMTQASVKRALAFSTVAQMGFMLLECGLGAFGLALLHLVAHSLYKAHAFLASGSVVGHHAPVQDTGRSTPWLVVAAVTALAGAALFGMAALLGIPLIGSAGALVPAAAWAAAVATLGSRMWAEGQRWARGAAFGVVTLLLAAAYLALHALFARAIADAPGHAVGLWTGAGIGGLFFILVALDADRQFLRGRPFVQALYVHARNGFYLNTLANRSVQAVWPIAKEHA